MIAEPVGFRGRSGEEAGSDAIPERHDDADVVESHVAAVLGLMRGEIRALVEVREANVLAWYL